MFERLHATSDFARVAITTNFYAKVEEIADRDNLFLQFLLLNPKAINKPLQL
jgi:hypothetical protein